MAKTVSITGPFTGGTSAGPLIAYQNANFTVAVSSASTDAAVTLNSLTIAEVTESDATISQPTIFPNNVPANSANPVLAPGGTLNYGFSVVFASPKDPGVSPNNPGGAAPGAKAMEADALFVLQAQAAFSDGTVASVNLPVAVLTAVYPFPVPAGGEALFQQGADSNLIAVIA